MRKLVLLLLLLVPTTLFAQDDWRRGDRDRDDDRRYRDTPRSNAFELTPNASFRWGGTIFASETFLFDEDVDVASSAAFGLTLGIPLGDTGMKLELMANRQSSDLETESGLFEPDDEVAEIDVTYLHAGLQFPFAPSRNVAPYAVVSAGIANLDPKIIGVTDENRFSASAGIGVKIPMSSVLSLRLEGRGYYTAIEDDRDDCSFCDYRYNRDFYQGEVNLGLTFSF
jgi:hypothetical protein